ncbi:MAG: acetolactate decarboxylase [Rubrobacter sp.]
MPIDTAFVGALHVECLKKQDLVEHEARAHHTLFQTSTIDELLEGNYDGDVSFAELGDRGDFGLGTLNGLDGEMIALDGRFYQVRADGRARPVDGQTMTPFAVVTVFEPDIHKTLSEPVDFGALCGYLDRVLGDEPWCCAIRVDGHFDRMKTRSVPRQTQPYPPLLEVVESQPTFEFRDVEGSLVGFRFPLYAQGINVAGYHFHFITDDRDAGGHVMDCSLVRGELHVDHEAELRLELPPGVGLPTPDPSRSREDLDRIERG